MVAWERRRSLLLGLTGTAATLDALAFLLLGKVFASFQSGNVLFMGIAIAHGDGGLAVRAGVVLACFMVGVIGGTQLFGARLKPDAEPPERRAFAIELALLVVLAVVWLAVGTPHGESVARVALLALAGLSMGYQAALSLSFGIPAVMTVAITATVARLGQQAGLRLMTAADEPPGPEPFLLAAIPLVYVACAVVVASLPDSWWLPVLPVAVLAAGVLGDAQRGRRMAPVPAQPTA